MHPRFQIFIAFWILLSGFGLGQKLQRPALVVKDASQITVGAQRTDVYLPLLAGKRVAVAGNHTSMIGNTHLVDSLLTLKVQVVKVFSPEHGFRGDADAGEHVTTSTDKKTGLPIISLYGKNKKPTDEQLADVDIILFDMQDVGTRFYTYISTMTYLMEAAAKLNKKMIVLDRPNPNGHYIDGPVLEDKFKSFVGLHRVPVVHGMTIGEYACMISEEKWLEGGKKCDLTVIECKNYDHRTLYQLPVKPSPNLTSMAAVYLYPSLCFFEGTVISVGRGTDKPFQIVGHPSLKDAPYKFTPESRTGAKNPKYEGQVCYGYDLTNFGNGFIRDSGMIYLYWLIDLYNRYEKKSEFFNSYFSTLAGTDRLKNDIIAGKTEEEIRKSWKPAIDEFKVIRKKYLLYPDFE
ncbi:MAG: DUF1343 domain-containing protein [Flavobacteriales bacterium]|nr:DUF1343 domain-containing protein [Flavobacteriales bacterium]